MRLQYERNGYHVYFYLEWSMNLCAYYILSSLTQCSTMDYVTKLVSVLPSILPQSPRSQYIRLDSDWTLIVAKFTKE